MIQCPHDIMYKILSYFSECNSVIWKISDCHIVKWTTIFHLTGMIMMSIFFSVSNLTTKKDHVTPSLFTWNVYIILYWQHDAVCTIIALLSKYLPKSKQEQSQMCEAHVHISVWCMTYLLHKGNISYEIIWKKVSIFHTN